MPLYYFKYLSNYAPGYLQALRRLFSDKSRMIKYKKQTKPSQFPVPHFSPQGYELIRVVVSLFPVPHLSSPPYTLSLKNKITSWERIRESPYSLTTIGNIFLHRLSHGYQSIRLRLFRNLLLIPSLHSTSLHFPRSTVKKLLLAGSTCFLGDGNGSFYYRIRHNMILNDFYVSPNNRHFLIHYHFFSTSLTNYNFPLRLTQPKFLHLCYLLF